ISGLTAFRHLHPADSPGRSTAAHVWLRTFAGATLRACRHAQAYASQIDDLVEHWRSALGSIRRRSALDLLLDVLPGVPLLTVKSAARLTNRSDVAAGSAGQPPRRSPDTHQRNIGKQRYPIFEAP